MTKSSPFFPVIHESDDYKEWHSVLSLTTCTLCRDKHGEIYEIDEFVHEEPPLHEHCMCSIEPMRAVFAGDATEDGADVFLMENGFLPDNYISKEEAEALGWESREGNLADVLSGMMIGGDVYQNRNGHLPDSPGRVWYEADINYDGGYRNTERLVYSNDDLVFVTYDHYETFIQVD